MAFSENLLVAGSYHGFNMYELDKDGVPNLVTSVVCPEDRVMSLLLVIC